MKSGFLRKGMLVFGGFKVSAEVSLLGLLAVFLLLTSCATLPEAEQEDIVGWLPPDADTVVRLVVPGNHHLVAMLLGPEMFESLGPVIDRLEMIAAGLDYDTGSIHVVVLGKWPKSIAASALNRSMEKQSGGSASWIDGNGGKLILVSGRIMLYSSDKADLMLERMEEGQKWAPLVNPGTRLPEADFIMWSDDSIFTSGRLIPLPPAAGNRKVLIESVVFVLEAAENGRYDLGLNLRTEQVNFVRPLTLMMRVVLMGLFGLSNDEENRESHRQMKLDVEGKEIRIFIPSLSLEPIQKIIEPGLGEAEINMAGGGLASGGVGV